MNRILIVDMTGQAAPALVRALEAGKGWDVRVVSNPTAERKAAAGADAIVLAVDAMQLSEALPATLALREERHIPVVLLTDLDRSGWDRTFSSEEAFNVDALLDLPVDTEAVVGRLEGILEAHATARPEAPPPAMRDIVARAIANEMSAEKFYRQAAAAVTHAETREVLGQLADEEKEHRRMLAEFRSGKRALPHKDTNAGSLADFLGAPEFSPDLAPADAFLLAARKERLAARLYEDWARLYAPGAERDLLLELAEVERGHQARVEAMFTNAAFPESW